VRSETKNTTMNTATIYAELDAFVEALFDEANVMPLPAIVDEFTDLRGFFDNTGKIPVVAEDEGTECPVFGNWGTHYEFAAWVAYRDMTSRGEAFKAMVKDILDRQSWGPEAIALISLIHALTDMKKKYEDKFGHAPVDLNKFVKSYMRYGEQTVLRADVY
jgi:hypothetical protein